MSESTQPIDPQAWREQVLARYNYPKIHLRHCDSCHFSARDNALITVYADEVTCWLCLRHIRRYGIDRLRRPVS